MKFAINLLRRDGIASWTVIARSENPVMIRQMISSLLENRLLENDENDTIVDVDFSANANLLLADLTKQIRADATSAEDCTAEPST